MIIYAKNDLKPKKVFGDEQGRYIAIEICYHKYKILILNIYAPNGAKTTFFEEIQKLMNNITYDHIIIAGDFNGTVDANLDRSKGTIKKRKTHSSGKLPNTFFKLVEQ